ncbi:MAG: VWA domain-containing protein [Deltaproteobacteria bacterium]|nr:VWA domain-containing protein [Deltaproteobacteria bacterium]
MIGTFDTLQALFPWAAGALGVLTLLYLLEPRRRQVAVPFGALWRKVLERAEARRIGRRWRRFFSWLFLAVCISALLAAVGEEPLGLRALRERQQPPPLHTVLLVDVSATMATLDGDRDGALGPRQRLDEARRRLRAVVEDALPRERFLVVAAAVAPRTQAPWSEEKRAVLAAIDGLEATDAGLDLERALAAAVDAVQDRSTPRVVVVTDGGPSLHPVARALDAIRGVPVRWLIVGPAALGETPEEAASERLVDNAAVERVGVRSSLIDPGRGVVSARVRNDRGQATRLRVLLSAARDGRAPEDFARPEAVVAEQVVEVPPRSTVAVAFADVTLAPGRFAVQVRPAADADFRDLAPFDDWGFGVAARRRKVGVLLVGKGNLFLEAALLAHDGLDVRRVSPQDYRPAAFPRDKRLLHGVDVAILDQVEAEAPQDTPVWRFDLRPHTAAAPGEEAPRSAGELVIGEEDHPAVRALSLHDANFDQVRGLTLPTGAHPLLKERGGAVLAYARDDGVRRLDFGIDLLETDLGGRYFMPLLVGNAVEWLAGEEAAIVSPLEVGRPWAIGLPVGGQRWTWFEPGLPPRQAHASDDALLASSEAQGIHVWTSDSGLELARPTRLADGERPGRVGKRGPAWTPHPTAARDDTPRAPWPAWTLLVAFAAAALLLEWGLYQRRRTV